MTQTVAAHREIERVFREVYGQAVATLVRAFGDITLAEDAVQDAFVVASERWRSEGLPPRPAGWIVTTARNRAIDELRRSARGREPHEQLAAVASTPRCRHLHHRQRSPLCSRLSPSSKSASADIRRPTAPALPSPASPSACTPRSPSWSHAPASSPTRGATAYLRYDRIPRALAQTGQPARPEARIQGLKEDLKEPGKPIS
jgi:hypothetical protein